MGEHWNQCITDFFCVTFWYLTYPVLEVWPPSWRNIIVGWVYCKGFWHIPTTEILTSPPSASAWTLTVAWTFFMTVGSPGNGQSPDCQAWECVGYWWIDMGWLLSYYPTYLVLICGIWAWLKIISLEIIRMDIASTIFLRVHCYLLFKPMPKFMNAFSSKNVMFHCPTVIENPFSRGPLKTGALLLKSPVNVWVESLPCSFGSNALCDLNS